jgi:3-deoxy-D-arabino-heptulosonate 7-phosphate (DAHP) synthase
MSDGAQTITPEQFYEMMHKVRAVANAVGRIA